jgi:hypothetical protein
MSDVRRKLVEVAVIYSDVARIHNHAMYTISELTKDEGVLDIIKDSNSQASSLIDRANELLLEVYSLLGKEMM